MGEGEDWVAAAMRSATSPGLRASGKPAPRLSTASHTGAAGAGPATPLTPAPLPKLAGPPEPPPEPLGRQARMEAGDLVFSSDFDSGNCWVVRKRMGDAAIPPAEALYDDYRPSDAYLNGNAEPPVQDPRDDIYEVWVAPDCVGTPWETTNRSWFHFSVAGGEPGRRVCFRIMNTNAHQKLFEQDMRPVYRYATHPQWMRVADRVTHHKVLTHGVVDIPFTFERSEKVYISFTYPYPHTQLLDKMVEWEHRANAAGLVFSKNLLCLSVDQNPVFDITLTSPASETSFKFGAYGNPAGSRRGSGVEATAVASEDAPPEGGREKKIILISARVHPCETPASFVLEGVVDKLLNVHEDPEAAALMDAFIFRIVPCLNPDGIIRGHCRNDPFGRNLNRFYQSPDRWGTPSIHHLKELFMSLQASGKLFYYMDLHAHHNKRGFFFYGNNFDSIETQVSVQSLAYLTQLASDHFSMPGCLFSKAAMSSAGGKDGSKEGSARVSLFAASGFPYCYTLEANFNAANITDAGCATIPASLRYSPDTWQGMGRAVLTATHGLLQPASGAVPAILAASPHQDMAGLRRHVEAQIPVPKSAKSAEKNRPGKVRRKVNPDFLRSQQAAAEGESVVAGAEGAPLRRE
ncbi:Cytosolic carboxypeptidase 6 [Diplonema papillatum]|nr:Cytosolic carboxypeptidase 6 [Diplonema papillatum]